MEYLGAVMHVVQEDHDKYDFPLHAGFCKMCKKRFEIDSSWKLECSETAPHGHLVMQSDSGSTVIMAPIGSKTFFETVLQALVGLRDDEKDRIRLALAPDLADLPDALQAHEATMIREDRFDRSILYSWMSL